MYLSVIDAGTLAIMLFECIGTQLKSWIAYFKKLNVVPHFYAFILKTTSVFFRNYTDCFLVTRRSATGRRSAVQHQQQ